MASSVSSDPPARLSRPSTAIAEPRPKTLSPKVTRGTSSRPSVMESGSSGSLKPLASGAGRPSAGSGLRITSIESAASVSISRRPSNRAERVQTMRALVMESHTPCRSATVIEPMVALDDKAPWMPEMRICRLGVDS